MQIRITKEKLKKLIKTKLHKAGHREVHADIASDIIAFADERGIHSQGAMMADYYAEQIAMGIEIVDDIYPTLNGQ